MVLLCIAFLEERECEEKRGRMKKGPVSSFFSSMQAMQRNPTGVLPSQQRLYELRFLQKLGYQKPCWDQARLSSLVSKQVDVEKPSLEKGRSERRMSMT